jgi:argininosuccinate lyase
MRAAASDGFLNATDFADYLVRKGVPFRTAHEISGKVVRYCIERGSAIEALPLDVLRAFSDVVGEDVYPALSLEQVVAARRIQGGPAPESVADAIASANRFLAARL